MNITSCVMPTKKRVTKVASRLLTMTELMFIRKEIIAKKDGGLHE